MRNGRLQARLVLLLPSPIQAIRPDHGLVIPQWELKISAGLVIFTLRIVIFMPFLIALISLTVHERSCAIACLIMPGWVHMALTARFTGTGILKFTITHLSLMVFRTEQR